MRDLTGHVYGRLTVLGKATPRYRANGAIKEWAWTCRCACGEKCAVRASNLRNGHTQSCGCHRAEHCGNRFRTHGEGVTASRTPEYTTWVGMKKRCCEPSDKQFQNYGGRGIRVCRRWKHSYENFLADMGRKPSSGHTLERRENNGNYTPENCYWATWKEQARNKRNNRRLTLLGVCKTLVEWCELTGLNRNTITRRLARGWSDEAALTQPLIKGRPRGKVKDGQYGPASR